MTIRTRIGLMILAFVGGLGLLAALSIWAGTSVQVNGPAYQRIVVQKDIIADVMPPPAYAIEAYLATHRIMEATQRKPRGRARCSGSSPSSRRPTAAGPTGSRPAP